MIAAFIRANSLHLAGNMLALLGTSAFLGLRYWSHLGDDILLLLPSSYGIVLFSPASLAIS
jgi:hypothetical protein